MWLWNPTQRFQITISNDLNVATMFYQHLIVDLAPVDSCAARRYQTSQISQRVTHKSSQSLKNITRVSLLYVKKLEWNPCWCPASIGSRKPPSSWAFNWPPTVVMLPRMRGPIGGPLSLKDASVCVYNVWHSLREVLGALSLDRGR